MSKHTFTIDSKCRILIPKKIRARLHWQEGDQVLMRVDNENNRLIVERIRNDKDLKAALNG